MLDHCYTSLCTGGVPVGGAGVGSGEGGTGSTGDHGDCHQENTGEQGQRTVYVAVECGGDECS